MKLTEQYEMRVVSTNHLLISEGMLHPCQSGRSTAVTKGRPRAPTNSAPTWVRASSTLYVKRPVQRVSPEPWSTMMPVGSLGHQRPSARVTSVTLWLVGKHRNLPSSAAVTAVCPIPSKLVIRVMR